MQRLSKIVRHVGALPQEDAGFEFHSSGVSSPPPFKKLLVANRGEIAIRIFRAAKALGIATVAVYAPEDKGSLHVDKADEAIMLSEPKGKGAIAPYLHVAGVIGAAKACSADAIHPGYGFLAENAAFAAACASEGINFVGPSADAITLFGDKTAAKALAVKCNVPIARGSGILQTGQAALDFVKSQNIPFPVLVKAVFGGGGRGQRICRSEQELLDGFAVCSNEAKHAFGDGACFLEEFVERARHVEVQILADAHGDVAHLFERDCSVQLRNQKMVEIAPPRGICDEVREVLTGSAVRLAKAAGYENAGTVEFLVQGELSDPSSRCIFLEMNPRIQVEHTVTEEVMGVDLVQAQLKVAAGARLNELGMSQAQLRTSPHGWAMQLRVTLMPGAVSVLSEYVEPVGAGIRVDSAVAQGRVPSAQYDPLILKLIVSVDKGKTFDDCVSKALGALEGLTMKGCSTNQLVLGNILTHSLFASNKILTTFVPDNMQELFKGKGKRQGQGKQAKKAKAKAQMKSRITTKPVKVTVEAPFPGLLAQLPKEGAEVRSGDTLLVISAMKMMNEIPSPVTGKVLRVMVAQDTQVAEGAALVEVEGIPVQDDDDDDEDDDEYDESGEGTATRAAALLPRSTAAWYADPTRATARVPPSTAKLRSRVKPSSAKFKQYREHNLKVLATLHERLAEVRKGGGEKYVALNRKRGKMLPRERIEAIIDPGTKFLELSALAAWGMYGGKVHSAGMVTGVGIVHGVECMFFVNDSTVKGGVFFPETSKKQLRAQEIAETNRLPCIYLVDGGGANLTSGKGGIGGGGSQAMFVMGGLQFKNQAVMSSKQIPQISAVLGKCTAGGAYIPCMSDETVIVKGNGTIYLGGPPLVRAATGEVADAQELGGAAMHTSKSGVADHMVNTEPEALAKVRWLVEHLSLPPKATLPMRRPDPPAYDPEELLGIIPDDTSKPFDVREVIARIVDGSRFHEFKPRYGATLVCGFAHIHGYPVGIVGNNGMLFSESALKGAHFVQLCGQRGVPLVFLHNITGFIVGTQYEQGGIAKDGAKMIMAVSCVNVPKFTVVLGGSHGAGNYAMCGPAFDPRFTFLWPNAKISVMGGQQAADVITIVKDEQLKRRGKPPLTAEQKAMMQQPIVDAFESTSSAYDSTRHVYDDGIIDPRETRDVLGMCISASLNAPLPPRGFGVFRM